MKKNEDTLPKKDIDSIANKDKSSPLQPLVNNIDNNRDRENNSNEIQIQMKEVGREKKIDKEKEMKLIEKQLIQLKQQRCIGWKLIVVILVFIAIIIISVILWRIFTNDAILFLIDLLRKLNDLFVPLSSFIFFSYIVAVQISMMPVFSWSCILVAYIQQNFFHTLILVLCAAFTSSSIFFIISSYFLRSYLINQYKDDILFKIIVKGGKERPYWIGILVRTLYVPIGYKNMMLPLSGMYYYQFIIVAVVHNGIVACFFILVGLKLGSISEFINPKSFQNKSLRQKITQIITLLLIPVTLIIIIFLTVLMRCQFNSLKQKEIQDLEKRLDDLKNEKTMEIQQA